jgi:hypothetical protein
MDTDIFFDPCPSVCIRGKNGLGGENDFGSMIKAVAALRIMRRLSTFLA